MRVRFLLFLLLAVGLLPSSLFAQLNAIGYLNVTNPPGYSLISWPFVMTPNNDPANVLDNTSGTFDNCQIEIWTNGQFVGYTGNHNAPGAINGWLEPNGSIMVNPGVGAVFYNGTGSNDPYVIIGTVEGGYFTNNLNLGLNLVGPIIPSSGGFNGFYLSFPSPSSGQMDGDQVYLMFSTPSGFGYTTYTADSLSYSASPTNFGWDGPYGAAQPSLSYFAQAFWYRAGNQPVPWVETYFVGQALPSNGSDRPRRRNFAKLSSPIISGRHRFQAKLEGIPGKTHVVEISSDLKAWKPVATNLLSSTTWLYEDPEPATKASRFYRAFALP